MESQEISKKVHEFVDGLISEDQKHGGISLNDSLILSGKIDSINALNLIMFLEKTFRIDFSDFVFDEEQLDSIQKISGLVMSKMEIVK